MPHHPGLSGQYIVLRSIKFFHDQTSAILLPKKKYFNPQTLNLTNNLLKLPARQARAMSLLFLAGTTSLRIVGIYSVYKPAYYGNLYNI